jgi:DNA-binding HxlR family transcriptional regulator
VTHPAGGIDDVVHHRHRLGILTIAGEARQVEFGYLREALELTAGNLNRHLAVLEEAGLVQTTKGYVERRPRTWVSITREGRNALAAEISALERLVQRHRGSPASEPGSPASEPGSPAGEPGAAPA